MKQLNDYFKVANELAEQRFSERPANVREMLMRTCSRFPEKEALICGEYRLSYQELLNSANALAAIFQNRYQIKKGERIAILLPNSIDYAIGYLAASQIGAISVNLNTRCRLNELEFMITNSRPKLLITCPELFEEIELFAVKYFISENIIMTPPNDKKKMPSLSDLIEEGKHDTPQLPEIKEEDISGLMYTSGTTGKPKGAMISHGNIIANSLILSGAYQCQEDDIDMILAPMFHVTGLYGQLFRSIYIGSTCVIEKEFKSEQAMKTIERQNVTVCVAVPTIFWLMMVNAKFDSYDLSSLKRIIYGGAPASPNFVKKIEERFPQAIQINAFGLTECTSIATMLRPAEAIRKSGSIGLPVPLTEIQIVDKDDKRVHPNVVGELLIKSPQICQGYWENATATEEAFKNGWLHTGDLAKEDEEGFIYLMDRKKDMIIRGGENIYSIEVENVLYSHPKILEASVVGVPDAIFGEQVKTCVVLKSGESATGEEIRTHCEKHLADYKVPKYIEFYDSLPRNPGGKVIKGELSKME
ncbi:MAG TPA: class I adenylate-forming enzyme family protein [Desulfatiglandales bacterium]|nr:class I adenylate-forming enzyme family protein [Desulfatiglandales bacterium]